MDRAIITYFPKFRKEAYAECSLCGGGGFREMEKGISILDAPPFDDFAGLLACVPPVFVRHVMGIQETGNMKQERAWDLPLILEAAKRAASFKRGEPFAVCCRVIGLAGADYNAKDVEVFVGSHFDKEGAVPVFNDYALGGGVHAVINILIYMDRFYLGVCSSAQTITPSANEYRVLSRSARVISRAENKLKEAVNRYKLALPGGLALDIGASPGGWSGVLADLGYRVIAVDPGALNPKVLENPNITHIKDKIQNVKFDEPFDLIVNDMNIATTETAAVMLTLAPLLRPGGFAVVTLKLAFSDTARQIREAAEILNRAYDIMYIANLAHNRAEVTSIIVKSYELITLNS